MKDRRVLVTGGAGFIGSHLAENLLGHGYEVRVLDDLSVGRRENIPAGCEFLCGSIVDANLVRTAVTGADAVFHLAARVTIRGSVDRFVDDAETNLMGTLHLLRASCDAGVRRFVFASSMAVYGDSSQSNPVKEDELLEPASPYGIAKLAAERYLFLLAKSLGIEPVVLRYFNTFGTRQGYTPYVGVITIFITRLLRRQSLTIYGDGTQVRDFVHVSDIIQANLLALETKDAAGKVFNIGTGKGTSVLQIADLLMTRLDRQVPLEFLEPLPQELRNSVPDISRAQTLLGYQPATDLGRHLDEVVTYLAKIN
jgi:UDP-glucose 4-epimerase